MGCPCKEKSPEGSQTPCPDANEESFRQAFLRESRKTSELAAKLKMATDELVTTKGVFTKYCMQIDAYIQSLQRDALAITAWADHAETMYPSQLRELEKLVGDCPIKAISKPIPPVIAG